MDLKPGSFGITAGSNWTGVIGSCQHVTIGTCARYPTGSPRSKSRSSPSSQPQCSRGPTGRVGSTKLWHSSRQICRRRDAGQVSQPRKSYESNIKTHIRPKWADYPLDRIKPMPVEQWLRALKLAPEIQGARPRSDAPGLQTCAERWCLIEMGKNPIALVRGERLHQTIEAPASAHG